MQLEQSRGSGGHPATGEAMRNNSSRYRNASLPAGAKLSSEDSMKKCLYVPAIILLVSSSLWAQARKNVKTEGTKVAAAMDIGLQPAKAATDNPNYAIGPEDVLTIDVWKEPEISRTVPVRRDGKISLPLLNDVQAAGLTPTQLSTEIAGKLLATVVNPQVTVIVAQMSSQRVYVLGQVTRGGAYPLVPDMTAVQALSIAGGFTPFANLKKIYIMRSENGQDRVFPLNYKDVVSGRRSQENIHLKPGDTIVVP